MYFRTPNYSVALNAKVGSSSMARAIIKRFQPKQDWLVSTAAYPAGKSAESRQWHWMCNSERSPSKPVVLLVREPVDRFVSAMQQVGLKKADVDAALDSLEKDTPVESMLTRKRPAKAVARMRRRGVKPARGGRLRDDVHFAHQHKYASGPTKCFRFPAHLPQAAELVGLQGPLPKANEAKREKPKLTQAQEARVRAYYAADQALFDATTQAGYVHSAVALLPPDPPEA